MQSVNINRKPSVIDFTIFSYRSFFPVFSRALLPQAPNGLRLSERVFHRVLESVVGAAFALVSEGIYFIPRPDSVGHHSMQFFNFEAKRSRSISTIENAENYLSVVPMAAGYFIRRPISWAAT
jgi:hypothetical protein